MMCFLPVQIVQTNGSILNCVNFFKQLKNGYHSSSNLELHIQIIIYIMANRTINFFTRRKYSLSPYLNSLTNGNPKLGLTSPILISKRTTTILCVRKNGVVIMAGDGQVSQGSSVVKGNARKVFY